MWRSQERATNEPPAQTCNNSLTYNSPTTNEPRASISMPLSALNVENNIKRAQCCGYEQYLQKQITTWDKRLTKWRWNVKWGFCTLDLHVSTLAGTPYSSSDGKRRTMKYKKTLWTRRKSRKTHDNIFWISQKRLITRRITIIRMCDNEGHTAGWSQTTARLHCRPVLQQWSAALPH